MTKIPLRDLIADLDGARVLLAQTSPGLAGSVEATRKILMWLERNQSLIKAVKRFEDDKAMDAVRSVFPDAEVSIK